jgi:AhpD family alkylhydroperoxidase
MILETISEQMAKTMKYIKPIPYASATGLTAEVYQQMRADFLHAPLLTLHSPVPEVMAGVWSILRETLLAGSVDRARKEVVAAVVSQSNACPFCVDAHTLMLQATPDRDAAGAILRGEYDGIRAPQLRSLAHWVLANREASASGALPPPFSDHDAPEIIGTVIAFHYINRMANVFLGDTLLPLPSALQGLTRRLYAATAGRRIVRRLPQGRSLQLLPQASLPDDMAWAAANPAVTGAFARLAAVVEEAGKSVLPEYVRDLVSERVGAWNGEAMGVSRRWVEDAVGAVKEKHRAAARLALLTALASYQVDSTVVEEFRSHCPRDAQLITATAWASLTAARRISAWVGEPFTMTVGQG